jgi:DNA-binding transcriptional regulator YiaG
MKTKRKRKFDLGDEIIAALRDTNRRILRGEPLTVRDVSFIDVAPRCGPGDIQGVRRQLGCSQAAFAAFLGVPLVTLSSWERGKRHPSAMALRFLHEIRSDPEYWRERMAKSVRMAG